jgi:hypothetical protein
MGIVSIAGRRTKTSTLTVSGYSIKKEVAMISHEGAGRVRLANGRRMSYRAYRETMAEQYPEPTFAPDEPDDPEIDELIADVRTLRHDVDRLKGYVEPREALLRAQADMASGKLHSDAPKGIRSHAAESDLWS